MVRLEGDNLIIQMPLEGLVKRIYWVLKFEVAAHLFNLGSFNYFDHA